jgi:hypothetical protein
VANVLKGTPKDCSKYFWVIFFYTNKKRSLQDLHKKQVQEVTSCLACHAAWLDELLRDARTSMSLRRRAVEAKNGVREAPPALNQTLRSFRAAACSEGRAPISSK